MQFLIIFICAALSCTKVTTQGHLARGNIKNASDPVFLNCLVFAFTFMIFSVSLGKGINADIIPYSLLFGALGVSFQIFYALSLKTGPFSASCMLINLSMVMPVVFSIIYYDEKVTVTKVMGITLCLLALFLNARGDDKKMSLKWIIYVALAFLSTGGISIVQKVFAKKQPSDDLEQFIFFGYLFAFIFSCAVLFVQSRMGQKRSFPVTRKNLFFIFVVAASLGAYQFFSTYGNSFIDAIILVPSVSGLATTLQMLSGRIIFKEKFTVKQIVSMFIGIAAILLISI